MDINKVIYQAEQSSALKIRNLILSLGYKLNTPLQELRFNRKTQVYQKKCSIEGYDYQVYIMNIEDKHSITWDDRIDVQIRDGKVHVTMSEPQIIIKDGKEINTSRSNQDDKKELRKKSIC